MVHSCDMFILHACTVAIVHACTGSVGPCICIFFSAGLFDSSYMIVEHFRRYMALSCSNGFTILELQEILQSISSATLAPSDVGFVSKAQLVYGHVFYLMTIYSWQSLRESTIENKHSFWRRGWHINVGPICVLLMLSTWSASKFLAFLASFGF